MNLAVNAARAARSNRVLILEAVQRAGAISRARLVIATGLTPATITNAVRELIEMRLVRSTGQMAARRRATAGAPSELLALDGTWHRVLSVHQGVSQLRLGVHDIAGHVLASHALPTRVGESPRATVRRVIAALHDLVQSDAASAQQIRGVGVGAVGLVDPDSGTVRVAPNLGWTDVPLRSLLEDALGWPVVVRNNVHGMAAGEARFASVPEQDAVYLYVGTGIGAAIIIGGRVHEGVHGAAGELGHLVVPGGESCSCGKVGCLETIAAEPAIVRRANELMPDRLPRGAFKPAVTRLVELAVEGYRPAVGHIQSTAQSLGRALAQVVEIVDPGAIIVNGMLVEAGDLFLEPMASAVHASAFAVRGRSVTVRAARYGHQAGMIGAATLALDQYVYRPQADLFATRAADRHILSRARPA
jgi:predicted NBD/HSP70 family sugar kinase